MKHPDEHQLVAYTDDALPERQRRRIDDHLSTCPACCARLERLVRRKEHLTTALHAAAAQIPLAPDRSWEVVRRSWRKKQPHATAALLRPTLRHAAMLCILAVLVAGLAGLAHTLATTGWGPAVVTPVPSATPRAEKSSAPGPLPAHDTGRPSTPTTVLILGSDGETPPSDEIDLIMLLHLDPGTGQAFILSIPRDLYVDVPGHERACAGSVYGIAEQDGAANGLTLARQTISMTLGLPVQRAVLVDLEGFVQIVDTIGGVDVDVPHTIDDPAFPDGRGGMDPLFIAAGRQHLDGALALRYARTRVVPAPGFDRSFRQRQLVLAAHDRVIQPELLTRLVRQASTLWGTAGGGIETNLSLSEIIDLALFASDLTGDDITAAALEDCCTVEHVTPSGRSVLLPQAEMTSALMEQLLEEEE